MPSFILISKIVIRRLGELVQGTCSLKFNVDSLTFRYVWTHYGVKELYRGIIPVLYRNGPSNAMFFILKEEADSKIPMVSLLYLKYCIVLDHVHVVASPYTKTSHSVKLISIGFLGNQFCQSMFLWLRTVVSPSFKEG